MPKYYYFFLLSFLLFVNVSLASAYNLNEDVANDIYFFINDSNNNEQNVPLTLEDALLQLERLKSLLKSMVDKATPSKERSDIDIYDVHVSTDGIITPPTFIQEEREKARMQKEKEKLITLQIGQNTPERDTKSISEACVEYLSCEECLRAECAWCIGARRCIDDIPWVCKGDHDHIGRVGKHKICPTVEENEKAHIERRNLQTNAEIEVKLSSLPKGSYITSCKKCIFEKATNILKCESCLGEDGQNHEPTTINVKKCPDSTIGNSNSILTCEEPKLSYQDAKKRADARLKTRQLEELKRVKLEKDFNGNDASGTVHGNDQYVKKKQSKRTQMKEQEEELIRRAKLSKQAGTMGKSYGESYPYETLNITNDATSKNIRRAYRYLTLLLHPDKNPASLREMALNAFRDIVSAYEVIGTPEKRAAFDDYGSADQEDGGFQTFWEYQQSGEKDTRDFYSNNQFITLLNEKLWDKRLVSDSIWLIEFYAPWCSHCRSLVPKWKHIAQELKFDNIEVGAVNCEKSPHICGKWFDIPSYPTIMLLNNKYGTQQIYHGDKEIAPILKWSRDVESEWRYLFANSNLSHLNNNNFIPTVLNSTSFWIVSFLDGLECSSCKTTITNMLRLGAALRGMANIGIVDCSMEESNAFCYNMQSIPKPPHAAIVKVWGKGPKNHLELSNKGEMLYNSNEIEPHLALQITERVIRLSLAYEMNGDAAIVDIDGVNGAYDKYEFDKASQSSHRNKQPPPMWNGPTRKAPLPWDGSGGGNGRTKHQIAGRV